MALTSIRNDILVNLHVLLYENIFYKNCFCFSHDNFFLFSSCILFPLLIFYQAVLYLLNFYTLNIKKCASNYFRCTLSFIG